ncbi:MAG TPA: XRE family transcriptional regulator [Bacteroidales bacterium]|nr:XRE family transcriptional regulator [Bacteroidales bacterium]HQH23041.1 XRE family transcriptional regulator [Bacteroidales bacterium]
MNNIFAHRLIAARKMAGLSLQSLADKLGNVVTKQSLNKYEQGKMKPDSTLILRLANILNVSVDYFFASPEIEIRLANVDFRKYSSKIKKSEEDAVIEKSIDILERFIELEKAVNLQESPEYFEYSKIITNENDAEDAAKELRKLWNLGYDPIPDVVKMLEDKGYLVIEVDASKDFDGMKADVENKKVIVLRQYHNGDVVRKRFTALHELSHHSLLFSDNLSEKEKEKLCHVFASAVLYPEEMAIKELHQVRFHFYQKELEMVKERWGISFPAIFNRALRLGIINDYVYRNLNMDYRARRLHLNEPGTFLSKEKPVKFERLIWFALGKEIISVNDAAFYAGKSVWEFREQIHQMA